MRSMTAPMPAASVAGRPACRCALVAAQRPRTQQRHRRRSLTTTAAASLPSATRTSTSTATSTSTSANSTSTSTSSPLSSLEESRQLQQAAEYQLAYDQGTLALGFSAGGLLFPYYLGVTQRLSELGILLPSTQLAGASAGSLIVACTKSGLSHDTLRDACFELARDCRDNGTRHRLRQVLEGTLRQLLPDDVAERCNGHIHVAVTRLTPGLQPTLVSQFEDREDLIQALLTSCHIPWYFDGSLVRRYRADAAFDGGITNFLPSVPGRPTARVCCLPRGALSAIGAIDISPDAFHPWPHGMQQMVNWALEPAEEAQLEMLIDCGRRDAEVWAQQTGLAALAAGTASLDSLGTMSSLEEEAEQRSVVLPGGGSGRSDSKPVGSSLIGLARTLLSHANSSRSRA